jgi:hypothetical protein
MIDWTAAREVMVMPKKRDTPEEIIQHLLMGLVMPMQIITSPPAEVINS